MGFMSKKEHKKHKKHSSEEENDVFLEWEQEDNKKKDKHHKKLKKKKKKKKGFFGKTGVISFKEKDLDKEEKKEENEEQGEEIEHHKKHKNHKKHKKHKKTEDETVDDALQDIYENEDGSMPDMSQFQQKKKRSSLVTAFAVLLSSLLFLATVAWVGFFVLGSHSKFSEEDIVLTISGDEQIIIGQEVNYRIRFRNLQAVALHNVELDIRYPEGFVFEESSLQSDVETNDRWNIGDLNSQDGDYIDISGRLYGDIDKKQSFRAFLNYSPENFSSKFQQVFSLNTEIIESPVEIIIEGADVAVVGAESNFTITVRNKTEGTIENLAIALNPYSGFSKIKSTPESKEFEDFIWDIPVLEAVKSIDITGIFNKTDDVSDGLINASVLGWSNAEKQGEGYIFATSTYSPDLLEKSVSARLAINGSLGDTSAVPGDVLNTTITVANAGEETIEGVRVRMVFDAPSLNNKSILSWLSIEDENEGEILGEQRSSEIRRGYITWTSQQISELRVVEPGDTVSIDLSLPIKTNEDITLADFAKYIVSANVELQYEILGEREFLTGNPIEITLNSDTELEVTEQVEQDSDGRDVHSINWVVTNRFHPLRDMKFEADFYGDINWDQSTLIVPAGEVVYDPETKKVIWTVLEMPIGLDVLALQFNITLNKKNPSQTNFSSKVKGVATDDTTGQQLFIIGDEILLTN
jgi:hypothetical protein